MTYVFWTNCSLYEDKEKLEKGKEITKFLEESETNIKWPPYTNQKSYNNFTTKARKGCRNSSRHFFLQVILRNNLLQKIILEKKVISTKNAVLFKMSKKHWPHLQGLEIS